MGIRDSISTSRSGACRCISGDRSANFPRTRAICGQLERAHGVRIRHRQGAIDDYDETAAFVCALGLVTSAQTSIAHLCPRVAAAAPGRGGARHRDGRHPAHILEIERRMRVCGQALRLTRHTHARA